MLGTGTVAAGCGSGNALVYVDADGERRSYYEHVPTGVGSPSVVVLVLHGGGGASRRKGRRMGDFTGFDALSDRDGFIAVYPNSWRGNWNDGREGTSAEGVDDLAYIDAVLADLEQRHDVDSQRIYSVGISNGGYFTQRLLCDRSERIAAGYSIVASMPQTVFERCAPTRPVSVAFAPGTADPLVPYEGGQVAGDRGESVPIDDAVAFWVGHNGCVGDAVERDLDDRDPTDDSTVHRQEWTTCDGGTEVVLMRVDGGGHTWPGGPQYLPKSVIGPVNRDFNASDDAWAFFQRHDLP